MENSQKEDIFQFTSIKNNSKKNTKNQNQTSKNIQSKQEIITHEFNFIKPQMHPNLSFCGDQEDDVDLRDDDYEEIQQFNSQIINEEDNNNNLTVVTQQKSNMQTSYTKQLNNSYNSLNETSFNSNIYMHKDKKENNRVWVTKSEFGILPFAVCREICQNNRITCFKFVLQNVREDGFFIGICDRNAMFMDKFARYGHSWENRIGYHGLYVIDEGLRSEGMAQSFNNFDKYFNNKNMVPFEFYQESGAQIGVKVDLKENIIFFRKINGRKKGSEFAMPIDHTDKKQLYPCVGLQQSYASAQILPYKW